MGTVAVEGTGSHEQIGDRAELGVGLAATGPDRTAAVAGLAKQVAAVEPALEHPALEVRSRRLWVGAEWGAGEVVGARAYEQVSLIVTDVAVLEEVLAALLRAEPAELHGPRWTLADPAAALREAQREAVADARERAEGFAEALGARLGELVSLVDSSSPPASPRMMLAARGEAAPDVHDLGLEPEPVEVTARCTVTWELIV